MKHLAFLLITLVVSYNICYSRNSALNPWQNTALHDTIRQQALFDFTWVLMINNPDSALGYAKTLRDHSLKSKSKKYEAKASLLIGMSLLEKSNYIEAESQFNNSIVISKTINDKVTEALAYCHLGGSFYRRGELSESYIHTIKSLKLAEESKNNQALAWAHNAIGCIYMDKGELDKARDHFSKSLTSAMLARDTSCMAVTIGNTGNTYDNNKIKQMECYEQSLKWTRLINNKKMEGFVLRSIGNRYSTLNEYDSAIYYYNLALERALEITDKYQETLSYGYLGTAYVESGNPQKAVQMLYKSLQANEIVGDLFSYSEIYKYLYQAYKSIGNTKKALEAHELFMQYQDSSSNEEITKLISQKDNEIKFQREQEKLKSKQEKLNLMNEQEIQKHKITRNSLIAGSLLLMLLLVVLINRNKLKRTVEMEKMRSRLSRDLHDDIGSTLSSINILSRTAQSNLYQSGNEKTKASLEKINERSQRLLDNMSDIIWNINPGNDTIEEVMSRMREYATTILEAKNIDYKFDFPKEKVDCKLSMEVKNNLYLIFKEAVNNLSKYSGADKAILSLKFEVKYIHLKIEDNGKGFNENEITHRGGLSNMFHRAEEIKGVLKINSSIEIGTTVELILPRFS
ncbi:MAG TPA: tetratricopeptide repeat protein [Bacteroidales bacterium]|nr:tetratricopeptide repeat protein [Bacteroidales bacterium]